MVEQDIEQLKLSITQFLLDPELEAISDSSNRNKLQPLSTKQTVGFGAILLGKQTNDGTQETIALNQDKQLILILEKPQEDNINIEFYNLTECFDDSCQFVFDEGHVLHGVTPQDFERDAYLALSQVLREENDTK